jgi:hypothetical protein
MTGGGGYITMRPWRHQQTLPPPQRDWTPPAGRPPADYTQRMAEPTVSGGGPGNPFAGIGVRIIHTGHIKGQFGELMSMRIGKMVKVVIERMEEVRTQEI